MPSLNMDSGSLFRRVTILKVRYSESLLFPLTLRLALNLTLMLTLSLTLTQMVALWHVSAQWTFGIVGRYHLLNCQILDVTYLFARLCELCFSSNS